MSDFPIGRAKLPRSHYVSAGSKGGRAGKGSARKAASARLAAMIRWANHRAKHTVAPDPKL